MSDQDPIFDYLRVIPHFKVGQRVRIITMLAGPAIRSQYIGKEGHVVGSGIAPGIWIGQVGYFVEIKGLPTQQFTGPMLELVIPDGAKPGSWDDSPWSPSNV